jgi:SPP1 gp7 family putative phage head morphogenesis protein
MKPRFKAWLHPYSAERAYIKLLADYAKKITGETERAIKTRGLLRLDGWSDDLTAVFLELAAQMLGIGETTILRLPEVYAVINRFNDRQWRLIVKAGTGIDIAQGAGVQRGMFEFPSISDPSTIRARFGIGVDVYRSEPWLAVRQTNWVSQNTNLIKSIAPQYMSNVEGIVRRGVMDGVSPSELAKQIKAASNATKNRAQLIATDQIGKANGELTRHRQIELGVKDYTWITAHDERVRQRHKARDGKEFSWDNPPSDEHPGMPIRCRCYASPVFID